MAAALAASLPAPQAAPTPSAPTYEAIPASMAKVIDIEAEIVITSAQLDAIVSVVLSIHGHANNTFLVLVLLVSPEYEQNASVKPTRTPCARTRFPTYIRGNQCVPRPIPSENFWGLGYGSGFELRLLLGRT